MLSSAPTLFNDTGYHQLKTNIAITLKENEALRGAGFIDQINQEDERHWFRSNGAAVERGDALAEIGIKQHRPLSGIILPDEISSKRNLFIV